MSTEVTEIIWHNIEIEAKLLVDSHILSSYIYTTIIKYKNFKNALINTISIKLTTKYINMIELTKILQKIYDSDNNIVTSAAQDIYLTRINNPTVTNYITPFLYFKGFHALQIHRVSHWLWNNQQKELSMYFYNHMTNTLNIDIHPAAKIGSGVMLDHATGIVIGETSVIENNVSIMQSVTLGSTGKIIGDRHPKIKKGVMIGAGAIILGNIEIGENSKIGAGAVVLHPVPPYSTATGNPAKIIDKKG